MKQHIANFFKGFGMGAANVIPGVSGGTVALITGIFERLIDSVKSFDIKAIKLVFKGKFKEFLSHTDFVFLMIVFLGAGVSVVSLAKALEFLFINYPIFIWAYFFGLILASVYFVGKTIEKWKVSVVLAFIVGVAIAISISVLKPANENDSFIYLILCGVAGISSMILPGLSGSFVLILMGNYELLLSSVNEMIASISPALSGDFTQMWDALMIIIPVGIGVVVGLLAFSHLLSWIYKKFKNQTIGLLTGFILGSLGVIWPWKNSFDKNDSLIPTNKFGELLVAEDVKVYSYKQILPNFDYIFFIAIGLIILGIASIWLIEKMAINKESKNEN